MNIIVVGAGLSGLMAAQSLQSLGHRVTVFDKGRGVGGRLATRRIDDATLDHGAQFFTVRSEEFAQHVNVWIDAGVVHEWCKGFHTSDGYPRYVGSKGMSGIAKHLASDLDVHVNQLVLSVEVVGDSYIVTTDDEVRHSCDAVILTAPIPQSVSLLSNAGIDVPADIRSIEYDCTLGLLAVLDSANHNVPAPGGMQNPDDVFSFIGDNAAKGISNTHALTFHANPAWSLAHFDDEVAHVQALLTEAAEPWLGSARILDSQAKKWRFATPQQAWPDPCWQAPNHRIVLAGDAFAGPKMEGAALSGLGAVRQMTSDH